MARSSLPMAIAVLSTLIHVCITIILTYALVELSLMVNAPKVDDDDGDDSALTYLGTVFIVALAISLLLEIPMLIACVFLIAGIKKERHQFIAPWVYLTGAYIVLCFLELIKSSLNADSTFAIKLLIIILQAAMWCPVFSHWKELKSRSHSNVTENSPLNVNYTTQVPGMMYNAGPGNYPQGPIAAHNYPPPSYGPQMPAGAMFYPVQNYATGIMPPSFNPHTGTVSYPQEMATSIEGTDIPPSYNNVQGVQQGAEDNKPTADKEKP